MKRYLLIAACLSTNALATQLRLVSAADCAPALKAKAMSKADLEARNLRDQALRELYVLVPKVMGEKVRSEEWFKLLETYIIPSLDRSPLLVTTLAGVISSRKSKIISAIEAFISGDMSLGLKEPLSPSDPEGGTTRQAVYLTGDTTSRLKSEFSLSSQMEFGKRFPGVSREWTPEAPLEKGPGVIRYSPYIHGDTVFVDSPGLALDMVEDEIAARAIKSSDLLMLSTSGGLGAIKSQDFRDRMKKLFGVYGHKKIVVIVSDLSPKFADKARRAILEFANDVYGTTGDDMPEGVVGAYLMPYSDEVQEQRKHPSFKPLQKTATTKFEAFDVMLKTLPQNAAEIKNFTFEKAVARVLEEVTKYERAQVLSHLTAQLYLSACEPIQSAAVEEVQFQFPAAQYLDLVIDKSGHYEGRLGRFERAYDFTFNQLLTPARLMRLVKKKQERPKQFGQLEAAHAQQSEEGIAQLLTAVDQEGNLQRPHGIKSDVGDALGGYAAAFTRATGIETLEQTQTPESRIVTLPPSDQLPPDVQAELKKMYGARTTALQNLESEIEKAVLRGLNPDLKEENVYVPRTAKERNRARFYKAAYLAASAAFIVAPPIWPIVPVEAFKNASTLVKVGFNAGRIALRGFFTSEVAGLVHEVSASSEDKKLIDRTELRMKALVLPKIERALRDFSKGYVSALQANAEVPPELVEMQGLVKVIDKNFKPVTTRLVLPQTTVPVTP